LYGFEGHTESRKRGPSATIVIGDENSRPRRPQISAIDIANAIIAFPVSTWESDKAYIHCIGGGCSRYALFCHLRLEI
jgi:hypothetical protein